MTMLERVPVRWSLITVSYNSGPTLRRYWSEHHDADIEWIVVDNGSSDDSVTVAEALGARVVRVGGNRGFSAANNLGLAQARGDYIAFVNPDVALDTSSLQALAAAIDTTGGLVVPQLLNDDGSLQPNGRGMPLLVHKIWNRLGVRVARNGYRITAESDESKFVFWAIGAAVAMSAETARRLHGWNERFFLYYEDKDLCIRGWRAGLPTVLVGSVRWTHGWVRATRRLRLAPWAREISSLVKFYSKYPEFLAGPRAVHRRHTRASSLSGQAAGVS